MGIDLLPEKLLQAIKKKKNDMNRTPLSHILQVTLVSQLLHDNAKIFISYILISTRELFRI